MLATLSCDVLVTLLEWWTAWWSTCYSVTLWELAFKLRVRRYGTRSGRIQKNNMVSGKLEMTKLILILHVRALTLH